MTQYVKQINTGKILGEVSAKQCYKYVDGKSPVKVMYLDGNILRKADNTIIKKGVTESEMFEMFELQLRLG